MRGQGGRQSRYSVQLEEKQNLKRGFGLREEQLKRYYREAVAKRDAESGPYLIELLERRLDNALFRAGVAATRPQARQMASHRLITVNGRVVNIPSFRLKAGDVVTVKESKRAKAYFTTYEKRMQNVQPPAWIELDNKNFSFKITGRPVPEEAKLAIDAQAVVELLSR